MSREPADRRELAERYGVPADETQYGHAGRHHGVGTAECPTELHHHHDERCEGPSEARADRRERAREAYWDSFGGPPTGADTMSGAAVEAAIETAIRVRITPEMLHEARPNAFITMTETRRIVEAAFRAAGFEVEK